MFKHLTFDKIYNATKEAYREARGTVVKKRNLGAIDSAINEMDGTILNAEEKLEKIFMVIKDGGTIDINSAVKQLSLIENTKHTKEMIEKLKNILFPAPDAEVSLEEGLDSTSPIE